MAEGKSRKAVLSSLQLVIAASPKSDYLMIAKSLAEDLKQSIEKEKSLQRDAEQLRIHPDRNLMQSRIPVHLLAYKANWPVALDSYCKRHPDDPAVHLLTSDRDVIRRLIPLLADHLPVRSFQNHFQGVPRIPRTCDFALMLIEFHSRCRFHGYSSSGRLFHMKSDEQRHSTIEQLTRWWVQNNSSTTTTGIRSLLEIGWEIGKIEMCQNLVELGDAASIGR